MAAKKAFGFPRGRRIVRRSDFVALRKYSDAVGSSGSRTFLKQINQPAPGQNAGNQNAGNSSSYTGQVGSDESTSPVFSLRGAVVSFFWADRTGYQAVSRLGMTLKGRCSSHLRFRCKRKIREWFRVHIPVNEPLDLNVVLFLPGSSNRTQSRPGAERRVRELRSPQNPKHEERLFLALLSKDLVSLGGKLSAVRNL